MQARLDWYKISGGAYRAMAEAWDKTMSALTARYGALVHHG